MLHALLIHGGLTAEELREVVPVVGESNVAYALRNAGLIENDDGCLRILPAAYPSIRDGLVTAGFPADAM